MVWKMEEAARLAGATFNGWVVRGSNYVCRFSKDDAKIELKLRDLMVASITTSALAARITAAVTALQGRE